VLMNGTFGDGTSTGKVDVDRLICTLGNELTITAQNQRKAKISDSGGGKAIWIRSSAYIIIDGLYARSMDNSSFTTSEVGLPIQVRSSNHVTVRNGVFRNPNRYANNAATGAYFSSQVLFEDNEVYVFHRHCFTAWQSSEIVVRRQYCNPRGGRIAGGFNARAGLGGADSVLSMYPCKDCILENAIADGTTNAMYLNEMNATFGGNILMSGSKILGSICYKCNYGNGIYINGRNEAGLNHAPQNITIRDVAMVDHGTTANGIRCSDCINVVIDHLSVFGTGAGTNGIVADDTAVGSTPTTNSITITNTLGVGFATGFKVTGYNTWGGNMIFAPGNTKPFSPALPSYWTNTSTTASGMGTCKVWVPADAAVKSAGTGGSDVGANILYRYVNGLLTKTPLWHPTTGEFPHGATDLDGTNAVAGESLFDFHTRINVNREGCPFPKNYGSGSSDTKSPASPLGLGVS
jgi:hypothetical protein